jgi:hypothetical protein
LAAKSSFVRDNLDFSAVFTFLADHIELTISQDLHLLSKIGYVIVQGHFHAKHYLRLIQICAANGVICISDFIDGLLAEINNTASETLAKIIETDGFWMPMDSGQSHFSRKCVKHPI